MQLFVPSTKQKITTLTQYWLIQNNTNITVSLYGLETTNFYASLLLMWFISNTVNLYPAKSLCVGPIWECGMMVHDN